MKKEYYGCEIVPDNEVGSRIDYLGMTNEQGLKFIRQLRELTQSDEPLVLVPTRKKGKTSSAATGSCHWAVKTLIKQHLGKMFTGYNIHPASSIQIRIKGNYNIDRNHQHLSCSYHSVWQTPEEKLVNVIDYQKYYIENELKKANDDAHATCLNYYETYYDDYCFMLPTNQHCYYEFLSDEVEIGYNELYYTFKREKKVEEVKLIKKMIDWAYQNGKGVDWLEDDRVYAYYSKWYSVNDLDNEYEKLVIYQHPYESFFKRDVKTEQWFNKQFKGSISSYAEYRIFRPDELKRFHKVTTYEFPTEEERKKKRDSLLKNKPYEVINTRIVQTDDRWFNDKDLFTKPSIISKKHHYEIDNHPMYDDRLEYRTIDKEVLNSVIKERISNMSESQLNYEKKRAEKKGITLEEHISQEKYKLVL